MRSVVGDMDLNLIIAAEAAEAIRAGKMTSKKLVSVFLDHISEIEERVDARGFLNADHAL